MASPVLLAFGAEAVPPNMLVVLDRSCSMRPDVGPKWTSAVNALVTGTLTLYACDALRSGGATDLDIVFGCPGPVLD